MRLEQVKLSTTAVRETFEKATHKIAPLWSLENFVAVNPYLGLSDMQFEEAMDFLHTSAQIKPTLPETFYLEALKKGKLKAEDISFALENNPYGFDKDADKFIQSLLDEDEPEDGHIIMTLTDVASEINGKRWKRFMVDRISFWASAYFDVNQATWNTSHKSESLFSAWKREASIDRSPEAMGLKGFRNFVKGLPKDHLEVASIALAELQIPLSSLEHYLNCLLMKMNGWAGFAARIDWDKGLVGEESHALEEFLSIMLAWELAFKKLLKYEDLGSVWNKTKLINETVVGRSQFQQKIARRVILQNAFDHANQERIINKINSTYTVEKKNSPPKAQAIFCIDVRSEVFRRNLEATDSNVETLGFAGFFAFPIEYVQVAHDHGTNNCPVLLTPSHTIHESIGDGKAESSAATHRSLREQFNKVWKSFKQSAVSCFSFVSPLGIYFLPKLLSDSYGWTRPFPQPDKAGLSKKEIEQKGVHLDGLAGIPLEDRKKMAQGALNAMSLTENFASTVLIVGHGSSTVNNPHGTGLDCGACGGNTGEANAKVAAAVLNDKEVREELKKTGMNLPDSTVFVPALHDTTTDEVSLFTNNVPASHTKEINELKQILKQAGEQARLERAERMNIKKGNISQQVIERSKDWSQVRPEWGLAGCSSFIVAPRERTANLNFGGKAFMHNYAWRKDKGFGVLELIMTAPMVVTSWINLQYYASTVDNKKFGSGNKTLHNVVGGLGVLEGYAGDLRAGLPWQSVHDGELFQNEPNRLNVIIEAPMEEMSKILEKHESIRQLCDNRWIYLFAMNDQGKVAHKYAGNLEWETL